MSVAVETVVGHDPADDCEFLPIVVRVLGDAAAGRWRVESRTHGGQSWIVAKGTSTVPKQGWKLHVSSGAADAPVVLERSLMVLAEQGASFKVAGSRGVLRHLNAAHGGPSQIGKFITVYPSDDHRAVQVAASLHDATVGLCGPPVPSDRALVSGSLVYYRYGAFVDGLDVQTPVGEILSALRDNTGRLIPDRRTQMYAPPSWVGDPFLAAGVARPLPVPDSIRAGRYVVVGSLYRSYSSTVQLALDLREMRLCVLKIARAGSQGGSDGRDATDRLRREADLLGRFAGDTVFPQVLDIFTADGEVVLVLNDFAGETLEQHVTALQRLGRSAPEDRVLDWGYQLAQALAAVHRGGLVHGDVKPANIVVTSDGMLRLIDFNAARPLEGHPTEAAVLAGTVGYMSPQQASGLPAAVTDDVYGLGCLLYYLASGAQPTQTAEPLGGALVRPIELLHPGRSAVLPSLIGACLAPDPADRPASMADVEAALSACATAVRAAQAGPAACTCGVQAGGDERAAETGELEDRARCLALAHGVARTLRQEAVTAPGANGLAWLTTHASGRGLRSRDLGMGTAGALLAAAEMAATFDDAALYEIVAEGARWLAMAPAPGGARLGGLYVGEAGIGAALLRAGQVLGDSTLLDAALARGRFVAGLPHTSPDLYNGTAGRLRFHLLLYDATDEPECIKAARQTGRVLAERAETEADGRCHWPIPEGYGDMSGHNYLGYAHGAAGIADALLDLLETSGDPRFETLVRGAASWLERFAVNVLEDGSGLGWPAQSGGQPSHPFWCHGATGIGQFFLHASRSGIVSNAAPIAERAAWAVLHSARWAGPTLCHGLAGNIEFLLDVYQHTGRRAEHLAGARALSRLLMAFSMDRDGSLVWSTESNGLVTPDYLVGYSGIGITLLRLADPEHRPRQLSRAGFAFAQTGRE